MPLLRPNHGRDEADTSTTAFSAGAEDLSWNRPHAVKTRRPRLGPGFGPAARRCRDLTTRSSPPGRTGHRPAIGTRNPDMTSSDTSRGRSPARGCRASQRARPGHLWSGGDNLRDVSRPGDDLTASRACLTVGARGPRVRRRLLRAQEVESVEVTTEQASRPSGDGRGLGDRCIAGRLPRRDPSLRAQPVSYTHLDVYKRQGPLRPLLARREAGALQLEDLGQVVGSGGSDDHRGTIIANRGASSVDFRVVGTSASGRRRYSGTRPASGSRSPTAARIPASIASGPSHPRPVRVAPGPASGRSGTCLLYTSRCV